ncbi:MAG: phosphate ABC transporter substrate-binding protein PstS, partial [Acidobacteria bacterium]
VLAYNLQGVEGLKLSRKAYSGVFLGKVTRWKDPLIAGANPGAKLPDLPINVVVRADSSGTSFVFSQHLSAISDEFGKSVGANTMPNWPVGTKSKGNEGVTASLMTTPGSIGYIEYGYAKTQKVPMAALENKSGKYVEASTATGQAALASVALPDDMIAWAKDPEPADAYPIVTYTWLICYKKYATQDKLEAMQDLPRVHPVARRRRHQGDHGHPKTRGSIREGAPPMPQQLTASQEMPTGALFETRPGDIAQIPSVLQIATDRAFRAACHLCALLLLGLVGFIVVQIAVSAMPAVERYGFGFLVGRVWDPNTERYGILAEIWGTLYTSLLALVIGTAFGVAAAIFLSEGFLGQATFRVLRRLGLHLRPVTGALPDQFER